MNRFYAQALAKLTPDELIMLDYHGAAKNYDALCAYARGEVIYSCLFDSFGEFELDGDPSFSVGRRYATKEQAGSIAKSMSLTWEIKKC